MAPNQKCKAKLQQKLCAYISDEQVKSVKKQCVCLWQFLLVKEKESLQLSDLGEEVVVLAIIPIPHWNSTQ